MKAYMTDVMVCASEFKTNKKGSPYMLLRVADDCGSSGILIEKEMTRRDNYKRGVIGTFTVDITDSGRVYVKDFAIDE